MAQSHDDRTHPTSEWYKQLEEKADEMTRKRENEITAGRKGENQLAEWTHERLQVTRLPNDDLGVLRISVGGIPDGTAYCNFRGDPESCLEVLERAAVAMRAKVPVRK